MFIRTTRARGGADTTYEYLRLVESYRDGDRVKQRVVCNLGRKDVLAPHADAIHRILTGQERAQRRTAIGDGISAQAWDWGPFLIARTLWTELGLQQILDVTEQRRNEGRLADRVLTLVANRLAYPGSEHGLARWLETDFVCDREGRRWLPAWRDDQERLNSKRPRVRVEHRQLHGWYRTLDQLLARKKQIEKELFLRLRDLFSLEAEMVFYDLTSTYFEGDGPEDLARHGHSRDQRPHNRQVLVGLVMINGWPIAHHVFPGNLRDSKTVADVLDDLEKRFGLKRIVFVGDRGMVTTENIALLKKNQHGYLVGLQRRRRKDIRKLIESATGAWIDCPVGTTAREKTQPPKTRVQEVASDREGLRTFVVDSEERRDYERAMRERSMERTRKALERLAQRVEAGRLRLPEKIGAAAARILARNHGHRYYDWKLADGKFDFFEHPVYLAREKAYEGKYLIQTEEPNFSPVTAVQTYKELSEVERAIRNLKDVIQLRPIHHQNSERVQAHIFVATLAFLLQRTLEKKLKAAGLDLSANEALQILRTVRVVDIDLGEGGRKRCVTQGTARAQSVLRAVSLSALDPPTPPPGEETLL